MQGILKAPQTAKQKTAKLLDVSDLHCVFQIEKATSGTPNRAQIDIYNLSRTITAGIRVGDMVIVEAGYVKGNYGMIYRGEVAQLFTTRDGTDDILTLICNDSDKLLTKTFVTKALSKGSTIGDVINACIDASDDDVTIGDIPTAVSESKLARGKVVFGDASTLLSNAAKKVGGQYYVEDGKLSIATAKSYSKRAVELNPYSGLINSPSQTDKGIQCECLLNPSIKLNTRIYVDVGLVTAAKASTGAVKKMNSGGVYRVVKIVYAGDTRGEAWQCKIEAVAEAGTKVAGVYDDEDCPWR